MLAQDIADNSLVLHNYHNWLFLFALLYHTVKDFFVLILLKTCEFCIFWTVYRFRGGAGRCSTLRAGFCGENA